MEKEHGKEEEELKEVKDLFKGGLGQILRATLKVSKEIVEGFKKGYSREFERKK
ncbi:MAG: hypothetical protein MUO29_09830 [Desulfobacterales bacterium]|nr:hypothetical protein [Desulfobacterales bacterium]